MRFHCDSILPVARGFLDGFERSGAQRFGIWSVDDALGRRIEELRWSSDQFRVWGTLRTDVSSYGGQYIAVQWLETVSGPGAETWNVTGLATASASSHLRADRWGQYQPWMARVRPLGWRAWPGRALGSGSCSPSLEPSRSTA